NQEGIGAPWGRGGAESGERKCVFLQRSNEPRYGFPFLRGYAELCHALWPRSAVVYAAGSSSVGRSRKERTTGRGGTSCVGPTPSTIGSGSRRRRNWIPPNALRSSSA